MSTQLSPESLLKAVVHYATKIARNMSNDPEMDSIANFATLHIIRTYDPSKGVPIQRWIARCVRQHVWQYWRKERRRKEIHKEPIWWNTKIIATKEVDYSEFPFLHKIYVEGMT